MTTETGNYSLWNCPTCNASLETDYCPKCGESRPNIHTLTLIGLAHQIFEVMTDIDSRLLRSLRFLVTCPGKLTTAYIKGSKKPYLGPFQLFLLCNVIFFAIQSTAHMNIVSLGLESHLTRQDWSAFAKELTTRHIERKHISMDTFSPLFNHAIEFNAKSFIILMTIPFSLLLPLVFYRNRMPFAAHAVFSLHFYGFVLLLFSAALIIASVNVFFGGAGLHSTQVDHVLSAINLFVCSTYLFIAVGRVYEVAGWNRIIKVLGLTIATALIWFGYRFSLFLITLYSI